MPPPAPQLMKQLMAALQTDAWRGALLGFFAAPEQAGSAAPLHKHSREDEYSHVLEGRMGALLGDAVVHADTGDLVFKPRDQWHTFWNAGDRPCRILGIISPEDSSTVSTTWRGRGPHPASTPSKAVELAGRYGIELQPDSIPVLCAEQGVTHPMLPAGPQHAPRCWSTRTITALTPEHVSRTASARTCLSPQKRNPSLPRPTGAATAFGASPLDAPDVATPPTMSINAAPTSHIP